MTGWVQHHGLWFKWERSRCCGRYRRNLLSFTYRLDDPIPQVSRWPR